MLADPEKVTDFVRVAAGKTGEKEKRHANTPSEQRRSGEQMAFLNVIQENGKKPDTDTSEAFHKMCIAAVLSCVYLPDCL